MKYQKYQIFKDLKKAIVLLVVISSVVSCSMDDVYSCNEDANQWAKSNLTEIRQMSSAAFLEIGGIVYQRAAFNAFTPNQRQTLWIEKLDNVLKLDWTEQESQFIESLLEFVKVNSFMFSKERDQEAFDKIEILFYKWSEFALKELAWDKKLLSAIVGTPQEMNENKEIISKLPSSPSIKTRSEDDCDCNNEILNDWCMAPFTKCLAKSCNKIANDCGWFWQFDCVGVCTNYFTL